MSTLRVVEDLRRKKNRQRPSTRKTRKNALIQEPVTSLSSYLDQPDVISEILSSTMPINAQTRDDFPSIPLRYSNSASSFPRLLNAINDDQFYDDNNNYCDSNYHCYYHYCYCFLYLILSLLLLSLILLLLLSLLVWFGGPW